MKIGQALVAVTYNCNSRCSMCNIWREKNWEELNVLFYRNLPNFKSVNISGGEPFLRKDIVDVVKTFDEISDRIVISSNGLLPSLIEQKIRNMPEVGVGISIDGIGDIHDKIRGIKGAYQKSLDTIHRLLKLEVSDLRIALTINDTNADQIKPVYDLANELGVEFTCAVAHNSDIYFKKNDNDILKAESVADHLNEIIINELSTLTPKRWFRAYFYKGLIDYIYKKKRILECDAGRNSFFLDPYGDIYPCNILNKKIGNLKLDSFDSIWSSDQAATVRKDVTSCQHNCWMICTAASVMKAKPYFPVCWIVKNKIRYYWKSNNEIIERDESADNYR